MAGLHDPAERPPSMTPIGRLTLAYASLLVFATFLVVTALTAYIAGREIPAPRPGAPIAPNPAVQIDAIRTGIGAGATVGGACALLLAFRRQRHLEHVAQEARWAAERAERDRVRDMERQERELATTAEDAKQRRITDLYSKSVDQIGSSNSAVRLGGSYALERLADMEEDQRQAVTNVMCAYLRMPFDPPVPDQWDAEFPEQPRPRPLADKMREEQVRLAVQNIITNRASKRVAPYWGPLELDLSDAYLSRFSIIDSEIGSVRFNNARFIGDFFLSHVRIERHSSFAFSAMESSSSPARFSHVTFGENVTFFSASFPRGALFVECRFQGLAIFRNLTGAESIRFVDCFIAPGDTLRRSFLPAEWTVGDEDQAVEGLLPIVEANPKTPDDSSLTD